MAGIQVIQRQRQRKRQKQKQRQRETKTGTETEMHCIVVLFRDNQIVKRELTLLKEPSPGVRVNLLKKKSLLKLTCRKAVLQMNMGSFDLETVKRNSVHFVKRIHTNQQSFKGL